MCAVIILFAFVMSLVINLVEKMIIHHHRQSQNPLPEDAVAAENPRNSVKP